MKQINLLILTLLFITGVSTDKTSAQTAAPYCAFQVFFGMGQYGYDNNLGNNFWITDVTVDGSPALNFTGGTSDAGKNGSSVAAGYNQGVFTDLGATVTQGVAYNWTMARSGASNGYGCNFRVYVDYNDDGDFNDAGENIITDVHIANKNTSSTGAISYTIPVDAALGAHRMRVVCEYDGETQRGACGAGGFTGAQGDAKDFMLTVVAPAPACPACENPISPSDVTVKSVGKTQARITWTGDTCVTRYRFYYREAGTTPWTHFIVAKKVSRAILTGLLSGTTYEVKVITVCSASPRVWSTASDIIQFTTTGGVPTRMEGSDNGFSSETFAVYPNPSNGNVAIAFTSPVAEKALVRIFNLMGQEVFSNTVDLAEGLNSVDVILYNKNTGIYTIMLQTSSNTFTQKLIVE